MQASSAPAELSRADIDALKSRVDLVDLIGGYITLKKRGKVHVGLCAFHSEKTPSFTVFPKTQTYKCFGCGANGDVIKFLQEMEQLSFPEVIERISGSDIRTLIASAMANPRPAPAPRVIPPKPEISPKMIELFNRAYELSRNLLLTGAGREIEGVRLYLEGRGFAREYLSKVNIGAYLPEVREILVKEFDSELLKKSGVIKYGMAYNYQLVTPHHSKEGKLVGLTFRLVKEGMDREGEPLKKYQHTNDLDKSYPFNLYEATTAVKRFGFVVVVEGHLDVEGLSLLGVSNAVCVGGCSLNADQLKHLIDAGAKNIYILFDADTPGEEGTYKAVQLIYEDNRVNPFVATSGEHKDVGEIMKIADRAKLVNNCIKTALFGSIWIGKYLSSGCTDTERQEALDEAKAIVTIIKSDIHKGEFLRTLSRGLKMSYTDILKHLGIKAKKPSVPKNSEQPDSESKAAVVVETMKARVKQVLDNGGSLLDVKKFLADFAYQNKRRLRGEAKNVWRVMYKQASTLDLSGLRVFIGDQM